MKLMLFLILCIASFATAAQPSTMLTIDSQSGEYVGQGKRLQLNSDNYTFLMTTNPSNGGPGLQKSEFLTIRITSKTDSLDYWVVVVGPPPVGELLQNQTYHDASRFGVWIEKRPHLDFYGQCRGVNKGGGYFTLRGLTRDANKNITAVAIDLVQYDDRGINFLKVSLRINSNIPIQPIKDPEKKKPQ